MAESDSSRLKRLSQEGICPYCGKKIPDGQGVGTGKVSDGKFCDLDCYSKYNQYELLKRHQERLQQFENDKLKDDK